MVSAEGVTHGDKPAKVCQIQDSSLYSTFLATATSWLGEPSMQTENCSKQLAQLCGKKTKSEVFAHVLATSQYNEGNMFLELG